MNWRAIFALAMPCCAVVAGIAVLIHTRRPADIMRWYFKSTAVFLCGIPVTLLGLLLVAVGIPFRRSYPESAQPFTMYPHAIDRGWKLVRLPSWLLWWDNAFDGLLGDRRGWWDNYCRENYGKSCESYYSMWQWAALRNPANYWSRVLTGCDVTQCIVTRLAGADVADEDNPGWQFIVAERGDGACFHLIQFCLPWRFNPQRAVFGRFGWKIKLAHNNMPIDASEKDRIKGSVYRISFWKNIGQSTY